ncbi:hypothetical protein BpHYR1_039991 [Brachionus plicatilis]|uniref:Uncharacterized protein n=1 Tax=Brachionus plicatilis TaxID=10195 RepID=A0A3M7SID2_BRAPC|nr:hypothetical protein BpHYR1_039991 [Brachionus plicatilis]
MTSLRNNIVKIVQHIKLVFKSQFLSIPASSRPSWLINEANQSCLSTLEQVLKRCSRAACAVRKKLSTLFRNELCYDRLGLYQWQAINDILVDLVFYCKNIFLDRAELKKIFNQNLVNLATVFRVKLYNGNDVILCKPTISDSQKKVQFKSLINIKLVYNKFVTTQCQTINRMYYIKVIIPRIKKRICTKNIQSETFNLDKFEIPAIFKYCICITKTPLKELIFLKDNKAKHFLRNYFCLNSTDLIPRKSQQLLILRPALGFIQNKNQMIHKIFSA